MRYVLPAITPFTTDFKTITVRFHGEEHLKRYGILPSELAASEFKFVKFKNVPSQGDLHLDVFIQQPEYLGVVREKGSRKVNDVDVPTYYYKGTVITPMSYELRDGARNIIEESIVYSASDHQHFYSDSYGSIGELSKVWEESQNIVISKKLTGILRGSLNKTALLIRDRFDDQIIDDKVNLFDLKKAEKINAEFLNTAFIKITSSLAENPMAAEWDDATKKEITDLLTKGTKFGTDDNDERVAYAIAHYNLAVMNLFWNNIALARTHISKGKIADRKIYEFEQIEKIINLFASRGKSDDVSTKQYVAGYEEGADSKLPGLVITTKVGAVVEDFSAKKARSIDTVLVKNGDTIIGYVNAVHIMRKIVDTELADFTHVMIKPLNMSQEEVKVKWDDVIYILHKGTYLAPLPTKIVMSVNPPINLYEVVKMSKDEKLVLMRTGYHESMPYTLNDADKRIFLYMYMPAGTTEYDLLPVSAGSRYVLGLNGALAKDFEFCSGIVTKANNKHYDLKEELLSELVMDYDKCKGK